MKTATSSDNSFNRVQDRIKTMNIIKNVTSAVLGRGPPAAARNMQSSLKYKADKATSPNDSDLRSQAEFLCSALNIIQELSNDYRPCLHGACHGRMTINKCQHLLNSCRDSNKLPNKALLSSQIFDSTYRYETYCNQSCPVAANSLRAIQVLACAVEVQQTH